jgi:hypothetical protein
MGHIMKGQTQLILSHWVSCVASRDSGVKGVFPFF